MGTACCMRCADCLNAGHYENLQSVRRSNKTGVDIGSCPCCDGSYLAAGIYIAGHIPCFWRRKVSNVGKHDLHDRMSHFDGLSDQLLL